MEAGLWKSSNPRRSYAPPKRFSKKTVLLFARSSMTCITKRKRRKISSKITRCLYLCAFPDLYFCRAIVIKEKYTSIMGPEKKYQCSRYTKDTGILFFVLVHDHTIFFSIIPTRQLLATPNLTIGLMIRLIHPRLPKSWMREKKQFSIFRH